MRKKIFLGHISPRDLPFSFQSQYHWIISVYGLKPGGVERLLLETRGYFAIPTPWTFAFHIDDDESPEPVDAHQIRVQVLDKDVLIADASEQFVIDWVDRAVNVHNLVLVPRAI